MLIDKINSYILHPHVVSDRARFSHYPSEASVISKVTGGVIGKCHRACFYDWKGQPVTNPIDARGQWTMDFGKKLEEMYVELTKQLGIWAGNNVKFYDKIHNISGEVDVFVFETTPNIIGVELKSAYGYGFQNSVKAYPKLENLLQVALYINHFKLPEWRLIYHSRDTMENVEYKITLDTTKEEDITQRKTLVCVNDVPCNVFFVEDIYDRYKQIGEYLLKDELPPRDFTYMYSPEQSADRFAKGLITKTKFNAVKNGKGTDSDWPCLYCKYLNHCWREKRTDIKDGPQSDSNE